LLLKKKNKNNFKKRKKRLDILFPKVYYLFIKSKKLQKHWKKYIFMKLLSIQSDPKTIKGEKYGYITAIMYLAPYLQAKRENVCPWATDGCASACLNTAGRGKMTVVQKARINRTNFFFDDREQFFRMLCYEIKCFIAKAEFKKLKPCIRLNGTSDITWETKRVDRTKKNIFETFPELQFYDYTKSINRVLNCDIPNYHLTFSRSENNDDQVNEIIRNSDKNVAVVFRDEIPKIWKGREVIQADNSDLRFLDAPYSICGLTAKGKAKKDFSGFVVDY
jgi:hypothetical protein